MHSSIIREARDLMSDGLMEAAADLLEEFVKEQPDNYEALHLISLAYLNMGQQELAASFLRRSLIAEKSVKTLLDASEFGKEDAKYYNESTSFQSEYTPGREYILTATATERVVASNDVPPGTSPAIELERH